MSDLKWGFQKDYGHKTLPYKWHASGYSYFDASPFTKKNFRPQDMPVFRQDLRPASTYYGERSQDERWVMSAWGCHREETWTHSLRSPRNPFPGRRAREDLLLNLPSPRPRLREGLKLGALRPASVPACRARPVSQQHPLVQFKDLARAKEDNALDRSADVSVPATAR